MVQQAEAAPCSNNEGGSMIIIYIGGEFRKLRLPLFYRPPRYKAVPWRDFIAMLERGETVTVRPANAIERAWAWELARAA